MQPFNRRTFLAGVAAVAASPALPSLPQPRLSFGVGPSFEALQELRTHDEAMVRAGLCLGAYGNAVVWTRAS